MTHNEFCGYYGVVGKEIEQKLEDCYLEKIKESRLIMSLGFDSCFGYDYKKLNNTVTEPLVNKQKKANQDLITLSLKTCHNKQLKDGQSETEIIKHYKIVNDCKKFFDEAISTVFDLDVKDIAFLNEDEMIKPVYEDLEELDDLKSKIQAIINPINKCKQPSLVLRDELIEKYLKRYLTDMASPTTPSFDYQNIEVLKNPEVYMLQKDKIDLPSFKDELNEQGIKKEIYLPHNRTIKMKKRDESVIRKIEQENEQKSSLNLNQKDEKESNETLLDFLKFWNSSEESDNETDKSDETEKQKEEKETQKNPDIEDHIVQIDNFWDKDIHIKNKRFSNEDYNRYKIKDWNIDKQINDIF